MRRIFLFLIIFILWVVPAWATVYVLLLTADPGVEGSFDSEANYTGYTRMPITFSAASGRGIVQSGAVTFPYATGGSNALTFWAIADSDSGGNMLAYGEISNAPATVTAGKRPTLADGEVVIQFYAGGISTAYGNAVLDWMFRGQALAVPDNIYVALYSTACGDAAPGTELTGSNYGRALCNTWNAAAGGSITNLDVATFPQATGDWAAAVSIGLLDASSGGTYMLYGPTSLTVPSGGTGRFSSGKIRININ